MVVGSLSNRLVSRHPDPSPRPYAVLEQPLPSQVSGGESGMLPSLKTCLQESDFHSQIYYSKKSVSKMLYTSMQLCMTDHVVITSFIGP